MFFCTPNLFYSFYESTLPIFSKTAGAQLSLSIFFLHQHLLSRAEAKTLYQKSILPFGEHQKMLERFFMLVSAAVGNI